MEQFADINRAGVNDLSRLFDNDLEKMTASVLKSFVLTKQVGKDLQFGTRCIRLREQAKLR